MPRRVTLTDRQREALLHLPVDQGELLRHYTLSDEDLGHIRQRRRAHNRFGFALQLCVLRYPGRVLAPGELIPAQVSDFVAAQLGLTSDDLLLYAAREETRHEHLADLRRIYGYRSGLLKNAPLSPGTFGGGMTPQGIAIPSHKDGIMGMQAADVRSCNMVRSVTI